MNARYIDYVLKFKKPAGTSRGTLTEKTTYFLIIEDEGKTGVGEANLFRGLSADDVPEYGKVLSDVCRSISRYGRNFRTALTEYPSIRFAVEQAFLSLDGSGRFILFPSAFTGGKDKIPINGLIWMGDIDDMKRQIRRKLDAGYRVLKLKIGALNFDDECALIASIRKSFSPADLEIRVDANGAFTPGEALEKLKKLSEYSLHSIEQPIRQGQWEEMARLCEQSPLPIALDEELIGLFDAMERRKLIQSIRPQYLILKPSLLGGFEATRQWIDLAGDMGAGWWITSALESNIGLNAIAQFTYTLQSPMVQGLGTGGLFTNNIPSPLYLEGSGLGYNPSGKWGFEEVLFPL